MARQYAPSWLKLEETLGRQPMYGSAEELRAQYQQLVELLGSQLQPRTFAVESKDREVNGIKCRVYKPTNLPAEKLAPVAIWTHGGGFVIGDLESDDLLCRVVAESVQSVVINVDYRLTPEWKAPTQLDDTMTVFRWAYDNAESFNGDKNRFYTVGGSAGGALALGVANRLVKEPSTRHQIKGVAAIVPLALHYDHVPAEYVGIFKAYNENAQNVPIIDKNSMATFYELAAVDPKDPDAFVALDVENHPNFPPTYLVTCEFDPLRDDGVVMEYALRKAGVPTRRDHWDGFPHYFWIFPSVPEGQEFVKKLVAGISWLIEQMK